MRPMGRTCFTYPPTAPDLNPIALAFAKLKAVLRATGARGCPLPHSKLLP